MKASTLRELIANVGTLLAVLSASGPGIAQDNEKPALPTVKDIEPIGTLAGAISFTSPSSPRTSIRSENRHLPAKAPLSNPFARSRPEHRLA